MRKRFRQKRQKTRKRRKRTGTRDSGGNSGLTTTGRTRNAPILALTTMMRRGAQTRRTRAASDLTRRDLIRRTNDNFLSKINAFHKQLTRCPLIKLIRAVCLAGTRFCICLQFSFLPLFCQFACLLSLSFFPSFSHQNLTHPPSTSCQQHHHP